MEEILEAIDEKLIDIPDKNKSEWKELAIKLAKLELSCGHSVSSIIDFIKSK